MIRRAVHGYCNLSPDLPLHSSTRELALELPDSRTNDVPFMGELEDDEPATTAHLLLESYLYPLALLPCGSRGLLYCGLPASKLDARLGARGGQHDPRRVSSLQ